MHICLTPEVCAREIHHTQLHTWCYLPLFTGSVWIRIMKFVQNRVSGFVEKHILEIP